MRSCGKYSTTSGSTSWPWEDALGTWPELKSSNTSKWSTDPRCGFSWMSTRLVAMDIDLKRGVMLRFDWTSYTTQIHQTASFFSLPFSLTLKPMYNTDLAWSPCTIPILFETRIQYYLEAISCTISISEPPLLQYLVLGELRSLLT